MGKCVFNPLWTTKKEYSGWLKPSGSVRKAKCLWCVKEIDISSMGEAALKIHMKGSRHSSLLKAKETAATAIGNFFGAATISSTKSASTTLGFTNSKDVLDAEILWCLKVITSHYSYKSSNDIDKLFQAMFPDSVIARNFSCSERKVAYLCHFGLAPHFERIMHDTYKDVNYFTILFDESLNKTNHKKQLDIHVRCFQKESKKVVTRYFTSIFMGHATAKDLYHAFISAVGKLSLKKLLQIGMDGPAVNWCFYEKFQNELKKELNIECITIGSCGLHILNNSFCKGESAAEWDISAFLKALYYLFKDSLARTEDFLNSSEVKKTPLKFCSHRWLENAPVSLRAFEIWSDVKLYIKQVEVGKLPKVTCNSFSVIQSAVQDELMPVKLLFFSSVAEILQPFLTLYQKEGPLLPFFANDTQKIIKQCLQKYKVLKDVHIEKISSSLRHLCDFDFADSSTYTDISKVSTGFRGDKLIKELLAKKVVSDKDVMCVKHSSQKFIIEMMTRLMNKCPINYSIVRNAMCCDPNYLLKNPKKSATKMKSILLTLCQLNRIPESDCDIVLVEFSNFFEQVVKPEQSAFRNFDHSKMRLDDFLFSYFEGNKYSKLWEVIKIVLTLSHGQASVERGFSVNKNIEIENLSENSYNSQRIIYDHVKTCGGLGAMKITKELRISCSNAHAKYKMYLEENKEKRKRTKEEEEILDLKKRKIELEKEIPNLNNEAGKLAQHAEREKNFSLLKKSNDLRKLIIQKQEEILELKSKLSEKAN